MDDNAHPKSLPHPGPSHVKKHSVTLEDGWPYISYDEGPGPSGRTSEGIALCTHHTDRLYKWAPETFAKKKKDKKQRHHHQHHDHSFLQAEK